MTADYAAVVVAGYREGKDTREIPVAREVINASAVELTREGRIAGVIADRPTVAFAGPAPIARMVANGAVVGITRATRISAAGIISYFATVANTGGCNIARASADVTHVMSAGSEAVATVSTKATIIRCAGFPVIARVIAHVTVVVEAGTETIAA